MLVEDKSGRRQHRLFSFGLVAVILGINALLLRGLSHPPSHERVSAAARQTMRPLSVQLLQGGAVLGAVDTKTLTTELLNGHPVILNFFASWCESCEEEAATIEAYWPEFKAAGGLIVGIAVHDKEPDTREFITRHHKSYVIGLDTDGHASVDYGVSGVPETFFIDASGIVQQRFTGPLTREDLQAGVSKLVSART